MESEMTTLNDEFSGWLSGSGLFANMPTTVPWNGKVDNIHLDALYFGARSGNKVATPIVTLQIHDVDYSLTSNSRKNIGLYLIAMFGTNWGKLWDTLNFEYNPIHNYSVDESVSDNGKSTRTPSITHTVTETRIPNLKVEESDSESPDTTETKTIKREPSLSKTETGTVVNQNTNTGNGQNNVFGFNSTASSPADSNTVSSIGSSTDTFNKQYGESGTENTSETTTFKGSISKSKTLNQTGSEVSNNIDVESGNEETVKNNTTVTSKKGNIGTNTTQQMINAERGVWFWTFFNHVFDDIDSIIASKTYL